ncbi:unnamed protein product [Caenorhabditis auriculariae]|uniref:Major sperm protein n=1 Tax=Caenorhabditis auriculariae TaxID=2777116 RepID=A0A8S1HI46_9PELO|nr:unnamed protein product [Caenorhabditis auriculariae]
MAEKDKKEAAAEFKMQLEPSDKMTFTSKKLGEELTNNTFKLTNTTKDRCVYKVKCTSNDLFRIRPPVGVLKPNDEIVVTVSMNSGKVIPESGKHYFAIYYIKLADEKKAPRTAWADHKGEADGMKRLYIDFVKLDKEGKPDKPEEKKEVGKEEEKKDEKKEEKKEENKEKEVESQTQDKKEDEEKK